MRYRRLLCAALLALVVADACADVCVWRDPDKTMTRLFPEAHDYRTVDVKISPEQLARIEKRLGRALTQDESTDWTYYVLVASDGKPIGIVSADSEKGEYGAIEIVMGLDPEGRARGVYIQRSRERKASDLAAPAFLNQFSGKRASDPLELGGAVKAVDGAEVASLEIAYGVHKMLVLRDELAMGDKK